MIVTQERLVADVRRAMNENEVTQPLLAARDIATLTLDKRIIAAAPAVIDKMVVEAPVELLDAAESFADSESHYLRRGRQCFLRLPDDFLRLHSFRLRGWRFGVAMLHGCNSAAMGIARRAAAISDVLCSTVNPVVAVTPQADGLYLEFFTNFEADSELGEVAEAYCYRRSAFDRHGGIAIPAGIYGDVVKALADTLAD